MNSVPMNSYKLIYMKYKYMTTHDEAADLTTDTVERESEPSDTMLISAATMEVIIFNLLLYIFVALFPKFRSGCQIELINTIHGVLS